MRFKITQYNSSNCEIDCRVVEVPDDDELTNQINDAVKDIAINNIFEPGDKLTVEEL